LTVALIPVNYVTLQSVLDMFGDTIEKLLMKALVLCMTTHFKNVLASPSFDLTSGMYDFFPGFARISVQI
jgi:hypothetical protein